MRGVVTNAAANADGDGLTMDLTTFVATDEEAVWAMAVYSGLNSNLGVYTFRWFEAEPTESPLTFLDAPRSDAEGMPLDSAISWAPVAGADRYALQVEVDDAFAIRVITTRTDGVRLPVLPDGFDDTAIFPPGEEWVVARVVALAGDVPPVSGAQPFASNAQLARGLPFSLAR